MTLFLRAREFVIQYGIRAGDPEFELLNSEIALLICPMSSLQEKLINLSLVRTYFEVVPICLRYRISLSNRIGNLTLG